MNKCDLEETRKQIDDIIAAAIVDREGWEYRTEWDTAPRKVFWRKLFIFWRNN